MHDYSTSPSEVERKDFLDKRSKYELKIMILDSEFFLKKKLFKNIMKFIFKKLFIILYIKIKKKYF